MDDRTIALTGRAGGSLGSRGVRFVGTSLGSLGNGMRFKYRDLVAYGPPCGTGNTKLRGPGRGRGITHRRAVYSLRSVVGISTGLLRADNELYVYRHPRELYRLLGLVDSGGVRPGELHLIYRERKRRP